MKGMSLIVKQVTKLVVGFIFLFAAYIVLYGHLTPGGGFAGGVIAACAFILLVLAFGKEFVNAFISDPAFSVWDCIGALGFLLVALAGYLGGTFFYNLIAKPVSFKLWSAGIIPLANVAIGIKVAAGLGGVFVALVAFRVAGDIATKEKAQP
ncbi:MAG: MnhB domain-containing protein [Planctomycetota bacterium]